MLLIHDHILIKFSKHPWINTYNIWIILMYIIIPTEKTPQLIYHDEFYIICMGLRPFHLFLAINLARAMHSAD